jgi:hypothetical protein
MYTNVVTTRQRVPHFNPPEAAAIATHPGPGFWTDAPSLQGLVRSEVVAESISVNELDVPTSNSVLLKSNGYFPRRAHRLADVIQRDDGQYQIGFDDSAPGPFESRQFAESVAARTMPVLS